MKREDLTLEEYHPFYQSYIDKSGGLELLSGLKTNGIVIKQFLKQIQLDKHLFKYAEGKWTIKELVQHIVDTERVFAYRALCISRKDSTSLPGFEQDDYVLNSNANTKSMSDLIDEYVTVRASTVSLFNSFSEDMLSIIGKANQSDISVRAIGFIILGHENHHCQIIRDRYL
ncbi:DinB family protein [Mangrovimonas sp. TPBH4]|uniref:DinB family protein n=1 Tax=Mangrovimonas sp. TPBH4 TaxID=1645914 RepID=UPI0006B5E0BF|nr:DinB family protein [Mangrovimonas sp. TPBH4]